MANAHWVLTYHPDYTTEQIAQETNVSLGTVKLLVRQAIDAYDTRTRAGAVLEAVIRGDIQPDELRRSSTS